MSGVFPVQTVFHPKPQGLGYVEAEVVAENPFFPQGMVFRGHEFHYSACRPRDGGAVTHALRLNPGTGMGGGADGLVQANTFAAYTHIFGPAVHGWAESFVRAARGHRDRLNKGTDLS
jgi:cobyrinic acid a,c-diamide synthase